MTNTYRWFITLGLGFLGGVIQCASDPAGMHPIGDYVRHGLIGLGPAVAALQLTLNRDEQQAKSSAAAGGK